MSKVQSPPLLDSTGKEIAEQLEILNSKALEVNDVITYSNQAAQSATSASTSATNASQSASDALASKNAAATSASNAQTSLNSITTLAGTLDTKINTGITNVETKTTEGVTAVETKTTQGVTAVGNKTTEGLTSLNNVISTIPSSYSELVDEMEDFEDEVIVITPDTPTDKTKIQINTTGLTDVVVPTYSEFETLSQSLTLLDSAVFMNQGSEEVETPISVEIHSGSYFYTGGDSATSIRTASQEAGKYVTATVEGGKEYRFTCTMFKSTYGLGYAIVDENGGLLKQVYDSTLSAWTNKDIDITVPNNASMIYINSRSVESTNLRKVETSVVKVERYETKANSTKIKDVAENGLKWSNDKKPTICFIFDQTFDDNRHTILENRGFRGTFSINNADTKTDVIKTLVKKGHDLSIYGGIGDTPLYTGDTQTEWETFIGNAINKLNEHGIYLPTMYACVNHKGSTNLINACKNLGFKYVSCGAILQGNSESYDSQTKWLITSDNSADVVPIRPYKLPTLTIDTIKSDIDDAVTNNYILCIFTHLADASITDPSQSNVDCSEQIFIQTVDYVKSLFDDNKVDVLTMRQLFNKYHEKEGRECDYVRLTSANVFSV